MGSIITGQVVVNYVQDSVKNLNKGSITSHLLSNQIISACVGKEKSWGEIRRGQKPITNK